MGLRRTKTAAGAAVDRRTRGGESRQHGRSLCELCLRAWLLRRSTQREREREKPKVARGSERSNQQRFLARRSCSRATLHQSLAAHSAHSQHLPLTYRRRRLQSSGRTQQLFAPLSCLSSPHPLTLALSPSLPLSLSPCLRSSLRFSLKEEPEPHSCPTASNLHPLASFHASFQLSLSSRPAHPDAQDAGR